MRYVMLVFTLVVTSVAVAAQVRVSDKVVSDDVYPRPRATFPGGVIGLPDLTYSTIPGYRRLTLDLYLPPGPASGARPTVVYIHGGGWTGGTPRNAGAFENWPEVLASIAARGYVVASIEYRFASEARYPAALHDVKNAVRWLRSNAATYAIDPQRILVWGSSAGGQLAGLAATSCGVSELEPPIARGRGGPTVLAPTAPLQSDCVQGAVIWYGASDLAMSAGTSRDGAPNQYLGCMPPNCAEQARAATVNTYVDAGDPPILLIHGAADSTVPVAQSQALYALLQSKGVRSELLVMPDIGHSFIGKTPEATREASRAGLDKTIAFIHATIGSQARSTAPGKAQGK